VSLLKNSACSLSYIKEYMNQINNEIIKNERIIYRAKCHWAILLGPVLVIIIGCLALKSQGYHAMVLIVFGLIWGTFSYIRLYKSEIRLTGNKILVDIGFPLKKSYDILLNEIMIIDFYQPSLGSMLNFGKIIIVYKSKKQCAVRFISCPAELVKEVQQQIIALKNPGNNSGNTPIN
jgi:hypothetical protein